MISGFRPERPADFGLDASPGVTGHPVTAVQEPGGFQPARPTDFGPDPSLRATQHRVTPAQEPAG
ncbi:hypothetical protein, partial [Asanoa hainanensis]